MNKVELIEQIAAGADISDLEAEKVLHSIIFHIMSAVKANEVVQLAGLGSFRQALRSARMGRNPVTEESVQIPESVGVKFRPGKAFKLALNSRD